MNNDTRTEARVVCFDLDGTVIHHDRRPDWNDAHDLYNSTRPYTAAVLRLRELVRDGHLVHIVTARRAIHGPVTLLQLEQVWPDGFPDAMQLHLSPLIEHGGRNWEGNKIDQLRAIQPDLYVGDQDGDRLAASVAGVPFMEAEAWRAGAAYPWQESAVIA